MIPAYNEERRLGPTLAAIAAFLAAKPYRSEILVVDDGSSDTTVEVASRHRAAKLPGGDLPLRILTYKPNRGKGHAVRVGMLAAAGEVALLCDADLSTPIQELDSMLQRLEAGADVVIGSRRVPGHHVVKPQPAYRIFFGRIHSWLCHQFFVPHVHDFTCGFKLYKREVARLFGRCLQDRWVFDDEILFLAHAAGYRIVEAPVQWTDDPATRVRLFRDIMGSLLGLAQVYCNHRLGLFARSPFSGYSQRPTELSAKPSCE